MCSGDGIVAAQPSACAAAHQLSTLQLVWSRCGGAGFWLCCCRVGEREWSFGCSRWQLPAGLWRPSGRCGSAGWDIATLCSTRNMAVLMFMEGVARFCWSCSCSLCTCSKQRKAPVLSLQLYSRAGSWCCMWQPGRAGSHCTIAVCVFLGQHSGRRVRCLSQLCSPRAVYLFSNHAWVRRVPKGWGCRHAVFPHHAYGLCRVAPFVWGVGGCSLVALASARHRQRPPSGCQAACIVCL